ncbi:MAG: DUF1189 domain-containing protein [Clostridia bacterium]|nr:DUF1189 domain-containing protein [Clostridia bacterium]
METKKKLFIGELIDSIKSFDYYKEVYKQSIARAFKYFSILILLYAIVATIVSINETNKVLNSSKSFIESEIKSIRYSEGTLEVDDNEKKSYLNDKVIIDTSIDNLDEYSSDFILVKDKFRITLEGKKFDFKYNDFINQEFDKQTLIEALDIKNYIFGIIVITLLMSYIVLFISTMLDVLVISLIGFIISSIVGNNSFRFKNIFCIAVHSITLSVVMGMIYFIINTFTGFEVKYFSTMYTSLATIYMITAILLIRSEKNKDNT